MEQIKISNHPEFEKVERFFEFKNIETDLSTYAKIQGFVYYKIEGKTPKGFNPNGEFYELIADKTTIVDSKTGQYTLEGDTTEIDYIRNILVNFLGDNLNVGNVLEMLVVSSVLKQDKIGRFNK